MGQDVISAAHNLALNFRKYARILVRKGFPARMQCSPHHNDLRIQPHVKIPPERHRPAQSALKISRQGVIHRALHNFRSGTPVPVICKKHIPFQQFTLLIPGIPNLVPQPAVPIIRGFAEYGRCHNHLQRIQGIDPVGFASHKIFHSLILPGCIQYIPKTAHFCSS